MWDRDPSRGGGRRRVAAVGTAIASLGLGGVAFAQDGAGAGPWLVEAEGALGGAVAKPQSSRFGPGLLPSAAAFFRFRPDVSGGARLRLGVLFDAREAIDPSLRQPGAGGLGVLLLSARVRPPVGLGDHASALGPWVEIGFGPALTGSLLRAAGELGVGWTFRVRGLALGPTLRYTQVFQPDDGLDGADAHLLLLGAEIGLPLPFGAPGTAAVVAAGAADAAVAAWEPPAPAAAAAPTAVADSDGDGIPDDRDQCPKEAEDPDEFEDTDGCPDFDNDKDGIADVADKCPNQPETVNGYLDQDGCPDQVPAHPGGDGRMVFQYRVDYRAGSVTPGRRARTVLRAMVELWRQHPEWERIDVEGHTDAAGAEPKNVTMSRQRARRVRDLLVSLGLPAKRIHVEGFGSSRPLDTGDSAQARKRNRRVEVIVRESEGSGARPDRP